MARLRSGSYGSYFGSYYEESETLTPTEKKTNARYIYSYLKSQGWTINAIAGILGNMEHESALNPGRWQGENVGGGPAYGLVQWDPWTKYVDWCTGRGYTDPSEMDNNLARIIYELNANVQYYSTDDYPMSFREFTQSTESAYYLACTFAWNYERSAVVLWGTEEAKEKLRQTRGESAEKWYTFLGGEDPAPDVPDVPEQDKKKGMSLIMMYLATRR